MITYDPEADAIYVYMTDPAAAGERFQRSVPLDDNRIVDYDADGAALGVELLGVSHGIDLLGLPHQDVIEEHLSKLRAVLS